MATAIAHGTEAGLRAVVAVFLAWAIVREVAPKRALPSLLAPAAAIAFAIPGDVDLLACAAVLFTARVAVRSVGDPPTWLDCGLLVALAGWVALRPGGLPVALVLAAIMFADSPPARVRIAGSAALLLTLLVGATEGTLTLRPEWHAPPVQAQLLLALTAIAAVILVARPLPAQLRVRDDRRRARLRGARVRAARIAVLASVLAAVAWTGIEGAFVLGSASAALLAAGIGGTRQRAARVATAR